MHALTKLRAGRVARRILLNAGQPLRKLEERLAVYRRICRPSHAGTLSDARHFSEAVAGRFLS